MMLFISPQGNIRTLYSEAIDLAALGALTITRASQVEPDDHGHWWSDLTPAGGPCLGPFDRRSEALTAEQLWLEARELGRCTEPVAAPPW